jgi:hypothetical protein
MEAKDLFARVLSNDNMQSVINCDYLPVIEVKKSECQQAYENLSAMQRCVLRRRVQRYAEAFASRKTPEAGEQYTMMMQIQSAIMMKC